MSGENTIVPKEPTLFDHWIRQTNLRQIAVNPATTNPFWQDYGWVIADSTAYTTDWHDEWVNNIYPKHTNPLTSTSTQKKLTHDFIRDFKEWINEKNLLLKIKASGIMTAEDEDVWHIDLERETVTKLSAKIAGVPVAEVKSSGSGDFDIKVMRGEDATRASINREAGADSVEYSYATMQGPDPVVIVDPNSVPTTKGISKKAHFTLSVGAQNQSRWLIIFFRWYNASYPQYAGTWSSAVIKVVA